MHWQGEIMVQIKRTDEPKQSAGRLPWFIDVFLYPVSTAGLAMLGLFVAVPALLSLAVMGLAHVVGVLALPLAVVTIVIKWIIIFYMFWYLGFCIRESADGSFRAPDNLAPDFDDGFGASLWQTLLILGTVAVCLSPAVVYYLSQHQVDGRFWLFLGVGGFFLPMALLSVIMQEGFGGLNPFRIILAILRTLVNYLLVVPVFYLPIAIIACFLIYLRGTDNAVFTLLFRAVYVYLLIVASHVLGRFFYRNEGRLDWF